MKKNIFDYKKILPLTALVLAGCGDTSDGIGPSKASQESTGGGSSTTSAGVLELSYVNSRNSNALVIVPERTSFPADTWASGAGVFAQGTLCDNSSTLNFDFSMTNTGTEALVGVGASPYILIEDKTTYTNGSAVQGDYDWTVTQAPTFPIAPGATTTFRVQFTNASSSLCKFAELVPAYNHTRAYFGLTVKTNSITIPDYELDLNIWGMS